MTDRELLEAAAKAAGMSGQHPFEGDTVTWNPLTDDGDALRLAVKLRATVRHDAKEAVASIALGPVLAKEPTPYVRAAEPHNGDPYAAARRAIVRAAAAMLKESLSEQLSHPVVAP